MVSATLVLGVAWATVVGAVALLGFARQEASGVALGESLRWTALLVGRGPSSGHATYELLRRRRAARRGSRLPSRS